LRQKKKNATTSSKHLFKFQYWLKLCLGTFARLHKNESNHYYSLIPRERFYPNLCSNERSCMFW
jgi:hypothetical protein